MFYFCYFPLCYGINNTTLWLLTFLVASVRAGSILCLKLFVEYLNAVVYTFSFLITDWRLSAHVFLLRHRSIGITSLCLGPNWFFSVYFQNLANPTALMLSAVMMLRHLQFNDQADRIHNAILKTIAEGNFRTADLGGKASTSDFTNAVCDHIWKRGYFFLLFLPPNFCCVRALALRGLLAAPRNFFGHNKFCQILELRKFFKHCDRVGNNHL